MGILSWLLGGSSVKSSRQMLHVKDSMDRVFALAPRLRLAGECHARLEASVAVALQYAENLVTTVPPSREASVPAWSSDACIHAFFARASDIAATVSRSATVHAYFDNNADARAIYAVLGMSMSERRSLGVALEGDNLRRDVVQTTINFSDHQIRICGRTEAEVREEIVRRAIDQLAMEGMARIADGRSRRDMLEKERALLDTRLRLLERQGSGMRGMLGVQAEDGAQTEPLGEEWARLQSQIEDNERQLGSLGIKSEALEKDLERMCEVLSHPQEHLHVSTRHVRLNAMNVIQEGRSASGEESVFEIARIPAMPQERAFSLICFTRADLLPPASMFETAERLLS